MTTRSSARPTTTAASLRTRVVWGALVGCMTLVGGGLLALDGARSPRMDGRSLSPLLRLGSGPNTSESLFQTREPAQSGAWTSIVIHHSGSPAGSPARLDAEQRGMGLAGLGYHFVIGNGSGMGDGELHMGYRWLDQLPGAHVAGPRGDEFNRTSIGICLVGNGDREPFTDAQLARLVQVVEALALQQGIASDRIYLHRDLAGTSSPGRFFPEAALRERFDRDAG